MNAAVLAVAAKTRPGGAVNQWSRHYPGTQKHQELRPRQFAAVRGGAGFAARVEDDETGQRGDAIAGDIATAAAGASASSRAAFPYAAGSALPADASGGYGLAPTWPPPAGA